MNARKQPSIEELALFDQETLDKFARLDRQDQLAMIRIYQNAKGSRLWTAEGRKLAAKQAETLRALYRNLHGEVD
jgi:hypothetical protein